VILTRGLTKVYVRGKVRKAACEDITLKVSDGRIFCLLGPNGAGKTTLVRILATSVLPSSGTATVNGFDVVKEAGRVRSIIGLMTGGSRSFYWRLSGPDNLEFFGVLQGQRTSEARQAGVKLMKTVGLQANGLPTMKYSTGMLKRLSLARALLHDPPVLLLDEPPEGVDPEGAEAIRSLIRDLRDSGKTVFITTHNMEEAERVADHVGILIEGKLVKTGSLSELRREMTSTLLVASYRSGVAGDLVQRLKNLCGDERVVVRDSTLEILCPAEIDLVRLALQTVLDDRDGNLNLESVRVAEPSLRQVFLKTVRGQEW